MKKCVNCNCEITKRYNKKTCSNTCYTKWRTSFERLKTIFERKVIKNVAGCWGWKLKVSNKNYSKFHFDKKNLLAHRVSWEIFNGKIPKDLCVLHKCDNRICTNPNHLFLGTKKDNHQDMLKKGRDNPCIGENHYRNKITKEDVLTIRQYISQKIPYREIAKRFKVSKTLIGDIKYNRIWKHVI